MEKTVYWYWHQFMLRSKRAGHAWTGIAQEYFGDPEVPFSDWWKSHEHLFRKPELYTFRELENISDFEDFIPEWDLRICINLLAPKIKILEAIGQLISDRTSGKEFQKQRGWPGFDDWSDVVQLHQRPNLKSLEKTLKIWDLYNLPKPDRPNQLDMAAKAELFSQQALEDMSIEAIKATVSRYKKWGDKIIENVAQGVFPKHT